MRFERADFKIILLMAIFAGVFGLARVSQAATLYLDIAATGCNTDGTATATYDPATRACGSGSATVYAGVGAGGGYPWEAGLALSNGDTLIIRAGSYYEDTRGLTGPTSVSWQSGAQHLWAAMIIEADNVTVSNASGESVWLRSGSGPITAADYTAQPTNPIWLVGDNITLQGDSGYNFHTYGCLMLSGTGNLVKSIDMSGGWDHQSAGDAWSDVVRVQGSTNAIIRDCKLHDNVSLSGTDGSNKALIMHEHDDNTLIENCYMYNPVTVTSYVKYQDSGGGNGTQVTYRYNFIAGGGFGGGASADHGEIIDIYHNVFINANAGAPNSASSSQIYRIHNNTIYGTTPREVSYWAPSSLSMLSIYNNIVYLTAGSNYNVVSMDQATTLGTGYIDYNNYYQAGTGGVRFLANNYQTMTFAAWNGFLGSGDGTEDHSVTTDPGFINASGSFSAPSDFKRISYTVNGRNGSVMGAYETGSETIGLLGSGNPLAPAAPTGLIVQ